MPSWFSMTRAVLPSITATHEFVVPRSMPMISPALALASHRRGARTGAGAAAARTRRDNSRDIDSMLAPAAGDCDRVSHALRLALFGALVWLCADREQPFVATRAGECRRRRSHGRQQAAACGWGLTSHIPVFLSRCRALTVCRSNTLWLLPQRRRHLRCRRPYLNNIAARGAPTANPRRRRLSRARSGLAFGPKSLGDSVPCAHPSQLSLR